MIWAMTRKKSSAGFLTKLDSNQSAQLYRLATRILKFCMHEHKMLYVLKSK